MSSDDSRTPARAAPQAAQARTGAGVASAADRLPAPLIFMASALSQYLGAGLAVTLFALMPSTTVAW